MNVLICIGCDTYDFLSGLSGAERDAKDVSALLASQPDGYDSRASTLLLSPSLSSVQAALNVVLSSGANVDVFTFFFAGHGAVKAGSFFLCVRDSTPDRLSTTAFPIIYLFSVVNELHPCQVNIVIDACHAGGSSFDLNQLAKPEVIGSSEASSIAFLGACSADEVAGETREGGILTRDLIKCLTGEREIQTKSPFLDLIEVGAVVCQEVHASHPDQKPIAWGLSLFGRGRFAGNPHYDGGRIEKGFPIGSLLPNSRTGGSVRQHSSALWNEYRATGENPCPRRLSDLLDQVSRDGGGEVSDIISFTQGVGRTLSVKARESSELLAPSQCLAACAVFLLPKIKNEEVKTYTRQVLREMVAMDGEVWTQLLTRVKADPYALLNDSGPMADLYYLPMRVVKTLGWIGLAAVIGALLPDLRNADDSTRWELAIQIVERYEASIIAVSDEQAPSLYVFLKACLANGQEDLAVRVANLCYASFADRQGNVTRVGTDGAQALRYILSVGPEEYRPRDWRPANPSQLLAVLLLSGARLNLGSAWDLRPLDRRSSGFYIPTDYRDFGRRVIENGMNYTHRIGFGVWTPADFHKELDRAMKESFTPETVGFSKEGAALCTAASLLFPDRLPLLLELMPQVKPPRNT